MEQEAPARPGSVPAVTLRRFELGDVDAMLEWASDPEVTAFMAWDACTSRDALLAFLRDAVLPHPWFRAVCLGGGGGLCRPVGAVSVTPTDDACRAELRVVLARAHRGKGVATAAARRAVSAAFGDLPGVERVEALVDVDDNAAARRVLEKAGFQREAVLRSYRVVKGRLRDVAVYSFISTDPVVE